jgi:hypothetical protein
MQVGQDSFAEANPIITSPFNPPQNPPFTDGSHLLPDIVYERHVLSNTPGGQSNAVSTLTLRGNTDPTSRSLGDGSAGTVIDSAMPNSYQNAHGLTVSTSGQMPYINNSGFLTFPQTIAFTRPDGTQCRINAGSSLLAGPWQAFFIVWNTGGNGILTNAVYNSSLYNSYLRSPSMELIGFTNGDSGTPLFHAAWVNANHFATVQSSVRGDTGAVVGPGGANSNGSSLGNLSGNQASSVQTVSFSATVPAVQYGTNGFWLATIMVFATLSITSGFNPANDYLVIDFTGITGSSSSPTNIVRSGNGYSGPGSALLPWSGAVSFEVAGGQTVNVSLQAQPIKIAGSDTYNWQLLNPIWTSNIVRIS